MDRVAVIIIVIAALYCVKDRLPFPLFSLPGDFEWADGRWKIVLPLMSCAVISIVVSFVMNLLRHR